jgi:predicted amidohydrolase
MQHMSRSDLRITLVQTPLQWEDPQRNLIHFDKLLDSVGAGETDLVVLPEMFNTGFTMNASAMAEKPMGETAAWMSQKAHQLNASVVGSIITHEENRFYNRLYFFHPAGTFATYDKKHLFRMAGEDQVFAAGSGKTIVDIKGWKILPLICYDLRFPVWSRNCENYDVLVYIASWPSRRSYAWRQLLVARAIENLSFVAAVNRTGYDGNGIPFQGDSMLVQPDGHVLFDAGTAHTVIKTVVLSDQMISSFRNEFPAYLDADRFQILPSSNQ